MPVNPLPEQHPRLPRAAIDAMHVELSLFDQKTRSRGRRYYEDGRVSPLRIERNAVSATVYGNEAYEVAWAWDAETWSGDCTCPVGIECKHLFALGMAIVAQAPAIEPRPNPPATAPSRLKQLLAWTKEDGAPVRRERSPLQRLREEQDPWLRERALSELLAAEPGHGINLYLHPVRDLLREPDPDVRCWLLARRLSELGNRRVLKSLAPYFDRPDLEERQRERARAELAEQLLAWAHERAAAAQKKLRVALCARPEEAGAFRVTIEARLTATRLADAPRTQAQLSLLMNEASASRGVLAAEDLRLLRFLVEHNIGGTDSASYSWGRISTVAALARMLQSFPTSPAIAWDTRLPDDFLRRTGVSPGGPVTLRGELVSLLPVPQSHRGSLSLELRFVWPDGTQKRPDEVVHLGEPSAASPGHSLVIADGAVWMMGDELPPALQGRFATAGRLPLPAAERDRIIGLLAATFAPVRTVVSRHTRYHAVQPVLAMDLRDDHWMQLRVFAASPDSGWTPGASLPPGAVLFELTPTAGWVRLDRRHSTAAAEVTRIEGGPEIAAETPVPVTDLQASAQSPVEPAGGDATPSPSADPASSAAPEPGVEIWAEAPQMDTVAPLVDWLAPLGATSGAAAASAGKPVPCKDADTGWWLACTKKRMELFAERWDERPRGVQYFGTERVRRLLSGSFAIRPRLKVTKSGVDWFAVSAEWESEGLRLTDADLAQLRAATTRFVKLAGGWVRRDVATMHDETAELLADVGVEPGQGEQRLTLWQLAGARAESLAQLEELGADPQAIKALAELRARVKAFRGLPEVEIPRGFRGEMRPYQRRGLDFLAHASTLGIGAILADDMGLGKTVQTLAWLQHLREADDALLPSLVVCPASVVHNWAREAERFTPQLRVLLLTSGAERHELRREIPAHDLIVTNYALLRRDIEEWKKVELRAAILDEAQNIKNPDAAVSAAARELRARHRLALTGTPLENRALDLWSISSFVNPGYLPERAQFVARYDRPDAPPHVRTLLAARLRPVLLRRSKKEVAPELPDRIEERRDCELTAGQRHLYLAEMRRSRTLVDKLSRKPGGLRANKIHVLAALTRLRQICCHPALAGGKTELGSGKFVALFELLEPLLEEGHKVLLFSQFVECLSLLRAELRGRGIKHHLLTGQTQTARRKRVVADFQEDPDPCVFLVSLKAGGTGLNLTAASYVVLFDPWWNPAVEAQAIDRTHRIGQDRTVIAYRMIASGTIEEKIWDLQRRKAALARDILGEAGFARSLTRDDLEYLLTES